MTSEAATIGQGKVDKLSFSETFPKIFSKLLVRMEEVDDWCVQITKDITKQDLLLIDHIGEREYLIMRDISEYLNTPYSTTTGIVDKLVKKAYLQRFYSEEDRRTVLVGLTDKAKELKLMFCQKRQEMSQNIAALLTEKEQAELLRIFEKIDSAFLQQTVAQENP